MVDAFNFMKDYTALDTLHDREMESGKGDERTVVDLLTDQIEFANGTRIRPSVALHISHHLLHRTTCRGWYPC